MRVSSQENPERIMLRIKASNTDPFRGSVGVPGQDYELCPVVANQLHGPTG